MKNRKKDTFKFVLFLLAALGLMALGHHFDLQSKLTPEKIRQSIENTGAWGPFMFLAVYCVTAAIPFPATLLSTVSGAVWGEYLGTLYTVISATAACCIPFALSRLLGRGLVGKIIRKNRTAGRCDRFASKNGFVAVLVMRLIPLFPWDVVNYVTGLCGIKFRDYVLASLIGTIPASFTYNLIGSSLGEPVNKMKITLIIVLVLFIAFTMILAKRKKTLVFEKTGDAGRPIMNAYERPDVSPMDKFNAALVDNVHPAGWTNPTPTGRYNLVVIGAGTAGLVCAAGAAGLGAKVALIERNLLGGDCLNVGCVPSKALIRSADVVATVRDAERYGVNVTGGCEVDFAAVMERLRRLRSQISSHDSARRFQELGVDVFFGEAKFTGPDAVDVGGQELKFSKAVIATGARAVVPPIEGLKEAGFLTNETVFSLTERPRKLLVMGGGPLGCEMAQAFRRLGSEVCIAEMTDHIMSREDSDAAKIVAEAFRKDGIEILAKSEVIQIETAGQEKNIHMKIDGTEKKITVDQILAAAGRAPNVEGLGLEAAGVDYDARKGVKVDDTLRTTNKNIFAAGDSCLLHKFTHTADASARLVLRNALFGGRQKWSRQTLCWCTYTSPAVAHTGLYEHEAKQRGLEVDTFIWPFDEVDRAVTDGQENGMIKVHVKKGTNKILGATIVAETAGDMISEITLAMVNNIGLGRISSVIHPYPTQVEAIHHIADAYNRTRLSPAVKKLFSKWLAMRR
jgi:pyruvate/2-oxoglutarate dehydrogenase complex dihydrolipoamide dehydrogenase (E3) component/uncharacterized membrane protein YdjX (TVP38/TMEM64 family)